MIMGRLGLFLSFVVLALLMMLCGSSMGLGSILVMLRGLLMCVGWHVRDTSLVGSRVSEKVSPRYAS
jgi:hypothetical protein